MNNETNNQTEDEFAESRERRRRINQAFRDADLELCLREIKAELDGATGESTILAALPKVQQRYISEIIEPRVHSGEVEGVAEKLDFLVSVGPISEKISSVVEGIRERLKSFEKEIEDEPGKETTEGKPRKEKEPEKEERKPPPQDEEPEEGWFEAHRALRDAERAWADGKKRLALELLRRLDTYSIKDHDYNLRTDGLRRLLEESISDKSSTSTRQSSAGKWVLILFCILAVAAAVVFLLDRFKSPTSSTQTQTAAPETLVRESRHGWLLVTGVDSATIAVDPNGDVIGLTRQFLPLTPGRHTFRIQASGFADTVIKAKISRGETLRVALSLDPISPPRGWLRLTSNPTGAQVSANGGSLGITPLDSVAFDPGRHTVRFTKTGRVPTSLEATVYPDRVSTVTGDLPIWHDFGKFQLNANPWAFVFVNGDSLGPTPLTTRELPTASPHELVFRSPDGRVQTRMLTLDPARSSPTAVTIEFAEPGILAIATTDSLTGSPVWANLWTGSQQLGESPGEFRLNPGEVLLRLEKPGYATKELSVTVRAGERLSLTIALAPHSS